MSMLKDFREFAVKGSVVDLAVAVIVGSAFGKIVSSLVNDIVMPVVGILIGGLNFAGLSVKVGAATIKYGAFIQSCVDFLIIAWIIFLAVQFVNRFRQNQSQPTTPPPKSPEQTLLEEIRDLLKIRFAD